MKALLYYLLSIILLVSGCGLLFLTNTGLITLRQPYIIQKASALRSENHVVAFINVNVVPMDTEQILPNQTVIIRDGIIEQMAMSSEVDIPSDALIVDAQNGYLIPGLVDMHVHINEENDLLLFVAHGVTSVRDMWGREGLQLAFGFPDQLLLREQIESGELLGPNLYVAGPVMEGDPPTTPLMSALRTPEEAIESITRQAEQGYDFIKIYDQLSLEVYSTILETAQEYGMPVIGHVPRQVGLTYVLESGQQITIEHLSGYIDPDAVEFLIPEDRLSEYAVLTREAGIWSCPTIVVYPKHVADADLHLLEERSEMAYVSPRMNLLWKYMFRPGAMQNIRYEGDYPAGIAEMVTHMTAVLHENDAPIIAGTDTGNPYVVPGASLLDELDYLVNAGLTPYEALATGTRNSAEALNRSDEFGTITEGKRADLILLSENPFDNISHIRSRMGVMVRGQWYPESTLQTMLDELTQSYSPSFLDRLWPLTLIALSAFMIFRKARSR